MVTGRGVTEVGVGCRGTTDFGNAAGVMGAGVGRVVAVAI